MPWLETNPVDQRSRFIDAYLSGAFNKTELCARFHISWRTGDKGSAAASAQIKCDRSAFDGSNAWSVCANSADFVSAGPCLSTLALVPLLPILVPE
jgi:hypothetical protein